MIVFFCSCSAVSSDTTDSKVTASTFGPPVLVGTVRSNDITESSGIVASRCQNNLLWTHNDSGDGPYIYALDPAGNNLGMWKIPNVTNIDWEDIAEFKDPSGACFIYIGEIGDNNTQRVEHDVYRIHEPVPGPADANSTRQNVRITENADILKFNYPNSIQNSETLMVHPVSGDIYVVSKHQSGPANVYRIAPQFGLSALVTAVKVGEVSVPTIPIGLLTGGDISPDGRSVILCDYAGAYELSLPLDVKTSVKAFNQIWQQTPQTIDRGKLQQCEAVGYSPDGGAIFFTSEGSHSPIVRISRTTTRSQ